MARPCSAGIHSIWFLMRERGGKPHMSRWESSGLFLGDQSPAVCPVSEALSPLA